MRDFFYKLIVIKTDASLQVIGVIFQIGIYSTGILRPTSVALVLFRKCLLNGFKFQSQTHFQFQIV